MPQTLEPLLRGHKFFAGLDPDHLAVITGCASNVVFPAGAFLFREGAPADAFFLIREGRLALEIAAPSRGSAAHLARRQAPSSRMARTRSIALPSNDQ